MRTSRYRKRLQKSRRRHRTSRRMTKKRHIRKKATKKRRGGASAKISTTATQSYGYEHGSSPRSNAANFQTSQNSAQQNLNSTHGGAKRKRGGSATSRPKSLDVPQFSQQGPDIGPQNANNTSVATNTSAVTGTVNATNDCYATNSCGSNGGGKKTRRRGKRGRRGGSKRVTWGCMS
jgi:hypothetical protein